MKDNATGEIKPQTRFLEIDALRGIAAVIIMVHHYAKYIASVKGEHTTFIDIIEYGKYTVEFFFVISGFLIFMTLENIKHTRDFLVSRFSRLYPAYWTCAVLTMLALNFSPFYFDQKITLAEFFTNLTMWQHWFRVRDIDGIYWTLAVEMCFYVLIYLVFLFKKQHKIQLISASWLALMLVMHYLRVSMLLPAANQYYWYIPLLVNGTMFIGGIMFYRLKTGRGNVYDYILILAALATHTVVRGIPDGIAVAGVFAIFWVFVKNNLTFLRKRVFVFLGFICYPLYLLHQYIGYELINIQFCWGINSGALLIITTVIIILVVATIITYTVERPGMRYLRKRLSYVGKHNLNLDAAKFFSIK